MRIAVIAVGLVAAAVAAWFALDSSADRRISVEESASGDSAPLDLRSLRNESPETSRSEENAADTTGTESRADVDGDTDLAYPAASATFQARLDREIERMKDEPIDVEWAGEKAQLLRNEAEAYLSAHPELRQRYSVAGVDCRTSACELTFYDFSPDLNPRRDDLMTMMRTIYADTWFESFEEGFFGVSTTENGLYEYRQYFTRRTTPVDLERLQQFRIPIAPLETPVE